MLEGELYVDFGYKRVLLTPSEGDLEIPAWARNRVIPLPPSEDRNAPGSYSMVPEQSDYMLDAIFYENYYRYMDHALAPGGEGISVIQVLCVSLFLSVALNGQGSVSHKFQMFDRGGSCLALPNSIPFSLTLSKAMTVVFGRWLGVILGYQPYYKEWTTDRETAKQRMSTSIFTSRFVRD
ncbi:hypothetical protein HBI24_121800 [Parastagonospora nodorum]|uniref:Uncharacterized protein n=1 Tax=Phaeosphaeria nodorum (strain SN15 / ATCC MYA-4574 / FGSC 10173) TaxID=321614 RepID=A0A7U2HX42_PHANO|nr:hypothetical protein HBH53_030090 [Parastagonospora nodorum]QRC95130.1 hypothetical protein JI435_431820 [Parastagonospora nodorum SN15]KAH4059468.1 hypothetical protein HBH49_018530 [Parastagonospora nodorum]KAH4177281.1 hypothetical protein HBH43_050120 [Parastagonospora nodorum]KAH4236463.1 hypothetical protein HBI05_137340 [Parastagonospora nodorum]